MRHGIQPLPLLLVALLAACGGGSSTSPAPAPTILSVSSNTPDGIYSTGDTITVRVRFSEPVSVTGGIPSIELDSRQSPLGTVGAQQSTAPVARYISGSGTDMLIFSYTIQAGDRTSDLESADGAALQLNGAQISDSAGTTARLALPTGDTADSLSAAKNLQILNWQDTGKVESDIFSTTKARTFSNALGDNITLSYLAETQQLIAEYRSHTSGTALAPVVIAQFTDNYDYIDSRAVVRPDGTAHVFWNLVQGHLYRTLNTCLFKPANTCSGTVELGRMPSGFEDQFLFGKELDQKAHLVWRTDAGIGERVFNKTTEAWSSLTVLLPIFSGMPQYEGLSDTSYLEDDSGNITLIGRRATTNNVASMRMNSSTGTWSPIADIENLTSLPVEPKAAMDSAGNILVIWDQYISSEAELHQIYGAWLNAGTGTWSTPRPVNNAPTEIDPTYSLAEGGAANLAVWIENSQVLISVYDKATNEWATPQPIDEGTGGDYAVAGMDNEGNIALAWLDSSSNGAAGLIRGRYFNQARNAWSAPVALVQSNQYPWPRTLRFSANNNARLVWMRRASSLSEAWDNWAVDLR
jgi:hypothetical protein